MANRHYDKGINKMHAQTLDWATGEWAIVLIDLADYTPNFATDEFLSHIPALARVATAPVNNRTVNVVGVATGDCDDPVFTAVTGDVSEAVVIYKVVRDANNAVVETSSPLFLYIDTATGLPATPNGGNIRVEISASGVYSI